MPLTPRTSCQLALAPPGAQSRDEPPEHGGGQTLLGDRRRGGATRTPRGIRARGVPEVSPFGAGHWLGEVGMTQHQEARSSMSDRLARCHGWDKGHLWPTPEPSSH